MQRLLQGVTYGLNASLRSQVEQTRQRCGDIAVPPLQISGRFREISVQESMRACNKKYQEEATGTPDGRGYAVGIPREPGRRQYVKFDGYDPATQTLKDAKGFGYTAICLSIWDKNSDFPAEGEEINVPNVPARCCKLRYLQIELRRFGSILHWSYELFPETLIGDKANS